MVIKSPAKQEVISFLTETKGKMNVNYVFIFKGTVPDAYNYIKQMRVELTRLRNLLRRDNKKPARFKVMVVSVKEITESPPTCEVILKKSDGGMRELLEILDRETIDALVEASEK